jgi:hypothetical protein
MHFAVGGIGCPHPTPQTKNTLSYKLSKTDEKSFQSSKFTGADSLKTRLKVTFMKNRLFIGVLEQWLKRYLFIPGEINRSSAVKSEAEFMNIQFR